MRRLFPAVLLFAVLATVAPLMLPVSYDPSAGATPLSQDRTDPPGDPDGSGDADDVEEALRGLPKRAAGSDPHTWQTSDRVIGPTAPRTADRGLPAKTKQRFKYRISRGVWASSYAERTSHGRVRYYVVTARWNQRGVGLRYGAPPRVAENLHTGQMVRMHHNGVAGINGDFFDIGDTGAPLGVGVDRTKVINGRRYGWNSAFYVGADGVPRIGWLPVVGYLKGRPDFIIHNVNSAQVMTGAVGVFTPRWGPTGGFRWTDGQRRDILMVHVQRGRVVDKRRVFPAGEQFNGRILVARGAQRARQLDQLEIGERVRIGWRVEGKDARMALTGSDIVLRRGRVLATDDSELHPRTAVGIDRKRERIVMLVVEGRQEFSSGYTMVEVARKLKQLGARAGLNLDGGGSSTMIGWRGGKLRVLNSPSDGTQRKVANSLVITARGVR